MNVSHSVSRTLITCGCLLAALHGPVAVVSAAPASAAHPSRVLARLRETPASVQAAGDLASALGAVGLQQAGSLRIHRRSALVPGLLVLDTPTATAAAASRPSPQSVPADDPSLRERIRALMATGLFVYVEPDYIVQPQAVPTDAAFLDGRQWHLRNDGTLDESVAGADIDAPRAWDVTTGSTDVIVAIVDSGIRATHQDLASQMWRNPGEIAGNGIDDDDNGYIDDVFGIDAITGSGDPVDDQGHGTHMAGIVGASANDMGPAVGVAWQVRLMDCRFLLAGQGGLTSDAIECFEYAVAHGARLINCSWGSLEHSQAQYEAMAAASAQGALFFCAAGNEFVARDIDLFPNYPAAYDISGIIASTSVFPSGEFVLRSPFNFGSRQVDLAGPGVSIFSTGHQTDSDYVIASGTSATAPQVAGVAALLLAREPGLTAMQVRDRLLGSVQPVASLTQVTATGGRLNAGRALTAAPDGVLETLVYPGTGGTILAGRDELIEVRVTDLDAVEGASVVGTASGLPDLEFRDDGLGGDRIAGDGTHTARVRVPEGVSHFDLSIDATAPGFTPSSRLLAYTVRALPENDQFADRHSFGASTFARVPFNNVGATLEVGEPAHSGEADATGGASVWYTWTAPYSERVSITYYAAHEMEMVVGVYTGTALDAMVPVDARPGGYRVGVPGEAPTASFTFDAVAGTTYQIAVDGFSGDHGEGEIEILLAPANDQFANRTVLHGAPLSVPGRSVGSTYEADEPWAVKQFSHFGSVWWSWTPSVSGMARIAIESPGDENLIVSRGPERDPYYMYSTNFINKPDVFAFNPAAHVAVTAGVEYVIMVDWGMNVFGEGVDATREFTLNIEMVPFAITPSAAHATAGENFTLRAPGYVGSLETHRWRKDGVDLPSRGWGIESELAFQAPQPFQAGVYTVVVGYGDEVIESEPFTLTVAPAVESPDTRMVNLSTRAEAAGGDALTIVGFVIEGAGSRPVLLRAIGPTLSGFGVDRVLPDPRLGLKRAQPDGSWLDLAASDNWLNESNVDGILRAANTVGAFPSLSSEESALLLDLEEGHYTALLHGDDVAPGIALAEVYDVHGTNEGPRLVNLSSRGRVGTGESVMIAGLVVSGNGPRRFLIRAVGPGLTGHGVTDVLHDPMISVFAPSTHESRPASRLFSADNWGEYADADEVVAASSQVGAFPLSPGSADAALVATLAPGIYTIQASGRGESTGICLVEVYVIPID